VKWLIVTTAFMLTACGEQYRYKCQNPKHFADEDCSKPLCQFSQVCPEYLVAPILEKQVEQSKPAPQPDNRRN